MWHNVLAFKTPHCHHRAGISSVKRQRTSSRAVANCVHDARSPTIGLSTVAKPRFPVTHSKDQYVQTCSTSPRDSDVTLSLSLRL
jgi:hypothetical protein